jgi:hypothetical protein
MTQLERGGLSEHLPPPEFWLIDPKKDKFPTPVDDRGLVDIHRLIQEVKLTVDPEFNWPTYSGIHHFYWPEESYQYDKTTLVNPQAFRDIAVHKGRIPRVFENWLHIVTLPPKQPSPEVMHYRMEAWRTAINLFYNAQQTIWWRRRAKNRAQLLEQNPHIVDGEDIIGAEFIDEVLVTHFDGLDKHLERHWRLPTEFQIIRESEPVEAIAAKLGKLIVPRAIPLIRAVTG